MKKRLDYISTSDAINGFSDSLIAKSEKNDCVVRAIASSSGMSYDKSHSFVAEKFNRIPKKGTHFFTSTISKMVDKKERLNRKLIKKVDVSISTKIKGQIKTRNMTVGNFADKYNKGTYMVLVTGHIFTMKDSKVIGNYADALKVRKSVLDAWKIGNK